MIDTNEPKEEILETPLRGMTKARHTYSSSQLSTSSGSSSPSSRHDANSTKEIDAHFPNLVQDKLSKLRSRRTAKTNSSFADSDNDLPVTEEADELEERRFLKKLPIVEDAQEFNSKVKFYSRIRGREKEIPVRGKSMDTKHLPLDRVQESKFEDDLKPLDSKKKHWSVIKDLNEFNTDRKSSQTYSSKRFSLPFENSIVEEKQEKKKIHQILSPLFAGTFTASNSLHGSNHGSHHSSLHNSPRFKLKVDEIDKKERKFDSDEGSDSDSIEPIEEEVLQATNGYEDNQMYMAAKHKMLEEKEFMKKIIKSEPVDEVVLMSNLANEMEAACSVNVNEPIQEENEDDKVEK